MVVRIKWSSCDAYKECTQHRWVSTQNIYWYHHLHHHHHRCHCHCHYFISLPHYLPFNVQTSCCSCGYKLLYAWCMNLVFYFLHFMIFLTFLKGLLTEETAQPRASLFLEVATGSAGITSFMCKPTSPESTVPTTSSQKPHMGVPLP